MLIRLLATLPLQNNFARTYLDVGTDHSVDDVDYWAEMAHLNLAVFRQEGVSLQAVRATAPIVQELANCLDHVRRRPG